MFAIYLPGRQGANPDHFAAVGLAELLAPDDAQPSFTELMPGPDGHRGIVAHWEGRITTQADLEWTKSPRAEFWFGRSPVASGGRQPPGDSEACDRTGGLTPGLAACPARHALGPANFARSRQHLGREVTLGDGHPWTIATVRQLPSVLGLDASGAWSGQVDRRYKAYHDAGWAALAWFRPDAEGHYSVSYGAGADFVCQALSVNYRVNRDVAAWLGLIRTDVFFDVARAATEFDLILAARQKKTLPSSAAGSPSTGDGPPA